MEPIGNFIQPAVPLKPSRRSERGDLLKEFAARLKKPIGYIAMRLTGFSVTDLYYIKSLCDGEEKRGIEWAKVFYGSIKNKPKENG